MDEKDPFGYANTLALSTFLDMSQYSRHMVTWSVHKASHLEIFLSLNSEASVRRAAASALGSIGCQLRLQRQWWHSHRRINKSCESCPKP